MQYEWDEMRRQSNIRKHKVDFADVIPVFENSRAITIEDSDPDEKRFVTIGMDALLRIVVVVYTWRVKSIRIISARRAEKHEIKEYTS